MGGGDGRGMGGEVGMGTAAVQPEPGPGAWPAARRRPPTSTLPPCSLPGRVFGFAALLKCLQYSLPGGSAGLVLGASRLGGAAGTWAWPRALGGGAGGGPGVALGAAGALCCVALLYTGVWLVESGRLSGAALAPAGGGARQQRGRARQGSAAGRGSRAKAVAGDDDSDRGGDGAVATPEQRARADRWVAGLWVGLIVYTLAAAGAGRAGAERAAAAEVAAVAAARAGRSRRADRTPLALAPPGLAPRLAAPPPAAKEQEPQGRPGNSRFDRLATPLAPPGGVSAKSLDALRERLRASRIDASSGGRAEAAAAAAWGAGRG